MRGKKQRKVRAKNVWLYFEDSYQKKSQRGKNNTLRTQTKIYKKTERKKKKYQNNDKTKEMLACEE